MAAINLLAGWVVGTSDFNENPVLSLDLGMEFGLRFRVCQKDFCFDKLLPKHIPYCDLPECEI